MEVKKLGTGSKGRWREINVVESLMLDWIADVKIEIVEVTPQLDLLREKEAQREENRSELRC